MPQTADLGPAKQASTPDALVAPGRQTLSELLARILDQLSLSAWLPAGVVVFIVLLAGSLRAAEGELGAALAALGDLSLASLVLILGAVVLTTVLTQAFQFEAIRLLARGILGRRLAPRCSDGPAMPATSQTAGCTLARA